MEELRACSLGQNLPQGLPPLHHQGRCTFGGWFSEGTIVKWIETVCCSDTGVKSHANTIPTALNGRSRPPAPAAAQEIITIRIQPTSRTGDSGTTVKLTNRPPPYSGARGLQRMCRFARDAVDRSLSITRAHSYRPLCPGHDLNLRCGAPTTTTRVTGSRTRTRSFSYTF